MDQKKDRVVILALKDQDGLDTITRIMSFQTSLPDDQIYPEIKAASQEYLKTADGRKYWEQTCHNFNYGDFDICVSDELCKKHGLVRITDDVTVIEDDYNTQIASLNDCQGDEIFCAVQLDGIDAIVRNEDVDDIMESVMTGCTYWCEKAVPVEGYLGEYASEQISHGGTLEFFPYEDDSVVLTPDNFREGLHAWLKTRNQEDLEERILKDNRIDPGQIDANDADSILQYALFSDIIYA